MWKKTRNRIELYYYKYPNIGDSLNELLITQLFNITIEHCEFPEADMVSIGSIMDKLLENSKIGDNDKNLQKTANQKKTIDIWGTGLMYSYAGQEQNMKLVRKCKIHALRGNLTRQSLSIITGKKISCVLADPGLLASLLIEPQEKKYDVGIIPHYVDADEEVFIKMREYYENSVLIDVKAEPISVLEKIAQCKVILSTSLHGLIIADSFGIPNLWCECSNRILGDGYKFRDYYSSYGLEAISYNLNTEAFPNLETVKANYKVSYKKVRKKQKELIRSFPYYTSLKQRIFMRRKMKLLK